MRPSQRYHSAMAFRYPALFFAALVPFVAVAAVAAPHHSSPSPAGTAVAQSTDTGVVEGRVMTVDYQRGIVNVEDAQHHAVSVSVTPTTSVQADDPGYHALSDVARGSRVQIFTARNAGRLVAQIIRLVHH